MPGEAVKSPDNGKALDRASAADRSRSGELYTIARRRRAARREMARGAWLVRDVPSLGAAFSRLRIAHPTDGDTPARSTSLSILAPKDADLYDRWPGPVAGCRSGAKLQAGFVHYQCPSGGFGQRWSAPDPASRSGRRRSRCPTRAPIPPKNALRTGQRPPDGATDDSLHRAAQQGLKLRSSTTQIDAARRAARSTALDDCGHGPAGRRDRPGRAPTTPAGPRTIS